VTSSYVLVRYDVLSVISCPGQIDVSIPRVIVSGMSSLAKGICGNGSNSKRLCSAFDFVLIRNFLKFTGLLLAENSANCFLFGGEKQTPRIPVCSVCS